MGVDCDTNASGCNGGWPDLSYNYVAGAGGLVSQSAYPYDARDHSCTVNVVNPVATCSGPTMVGPISICLCASSSAFGSYQGGIFDDPSCPTSINHAVAAVGYDTNQNYWIVRNSWGTSWGESGYMRMIKGKNMCGVLSHSCYPNV